MLTIFSDSFLNATRAAKYHNRRPLKTWEIEREQAERRRRAMRNAGMW